MEYTPYVGQSLHNLFRRCVTCPNDTPSCPACAPDEVCTQISENCDQCASRVCIKSSQAGTTQQINGGRSPNVGAIAGGVIGGVLVIAVATWLIWRFFIKNKQQAYDDVLVEEDQVPEVEKNQFSAQRSARTSTHTVESFASTAFTRASNVIQIAFIPGITDRSGNAIPPVPPVPIPTNPSPSAALSNGMDHYFMPSDLRDSTFTGYSDDESRDSITRQSLSPSLFRGSVASTIFRNGAVVDAEAVQTAHRGRAAVVSVRGTPTDTPPSGVPAVPKIDYVKYSAQDSHDSQLINLGNSTAGGPSRAPGLLQPTTFTGMPARRIPTDMTAAITEATRRASRVPTHGGLGSLQRDASPFSDEHAI